jgi:hypothetical protein
MEVGIDITLGKREGNVRRTLWADVARIKSSQKDEEEEKRNLTALCEYLKPFVEEGWRIKYRYESISDYMLQCMKVAAFHPNECTRHAPTTR